LLAQSLPASRLALRFRWARCSIPAPEPAYWTPVAVKQLGDDQALVEGTLKASDRVAALGAHLLREGQVVRLADSATSTAANGARQ